MDEKRFDDIMETWATGEQSSAPRLRPKQEMYDMVKAKRRTLWLPVMTRWVPVGVAAAIIVVVAILHPSLSPFPIFQGEKVSQEAVDKARDGSREDVLEGTYNEAKDMAETIIVADKEKQEPGSEGMIGETESVPPLADEWGARQTLPESSEPPPAPAAEELTETSVESQEPERKLGLEFSDAPQSAEPQPVPAITRSRMKGTPPVEQKYLDADRRILPEKEQKKAPIEESVVEDNSGGDVLLNTQLPIDQPAIVEEWTPVPGKSVPSPSDLSVSGRSSSTRSILPEPSEDAAEAELPAEFTAPASPKICALPAAEKTIGNKTFRLQGDVWIDTEYDAASAGTHAAEQERLVIQRDSQAYDDLLRLLPEMQAYGELNESMIISLGKVVVEIGNEGRTQLTEDDVRLLKSLQKSE